MTDDICLWELRKKIQASQSIEFYEIAVVNMNGKTKSNSCLKMTRLANFRGSVQNVSGSETMFQTEILYLNWRIECKKQTSHGRK